MNIGRAKALRDLTCVPSNSIEWRVESRKSSVWVVENAIVTITINFFFFFAVALREGIQLLFNSIRVSLAIPFLYVCIFLLFLSLIIVIFLYCYFFTPWP